MALQQIGPPEHIAKGESIWEHILDVEWWKNVIGCARLILNMEITPASAGKIIYSDSNIKFVLTPGGSGGSSSSAPQFFALSNASTTVGGATTLKVKVTASDINSAEIAEQTFTVTATGKVWAHVTSSSDYVETAWAIEHGAAVPDNDELNGYEPIGNYTVTGGVLTVSNLRFGPVGYLNASGNDHVFW